MRKYDKEKAARAQRAYCTAEHQPDFVGNGDCVHCHENAFENVDGYGRRSSGFSVEEAGRQLITYCPHCHRSFVD